MPLTALAAALAKPKEKPYKLSDEKGLYLHVMPEDIKYWRMKYHFAGKEKVLSLGQYPEISLKDARNIRDEAHKLVSNGIDPDAIKRAWEAAQNEAHQLKSS